jgi:hypothetical protein
MIKLSLGLDHSLRSHLPFVAHMDAWDRETQIHIIISLIR